MNKQPNGLYAARMQCGYSAEEVAYLIGVKHKQTIYRWERGETSPSGVQFLKLMRIYNATMDDLYSDMVKKVDRDVTARQKMLERKKKGKEQPGFLQLFSDRVGFPCYP